ncbi:MAG: pectinesterase family protein [candidate division WOR-3 bacterium]
MRTALLLACLLSACAGPARVTSFHLLTAADADLVVAGDGSGDFRTITDALRRAQPGSLILVRPGRYREAVALHSGIRLVGSGPDATVIDAGAAPAALVLQDSGSVVSGLALVNASETGIVVASGRHYVERCLIAGNGQNGIALTGNSCVALELDHCTIADNPVAGLSLSSAVAGITIRNSILAFNGRAAARTEPQPAAGQISLERSCLNNLDLGSDSLLMGNALILADPGFLNRPRDYRLSSASPCLDKAPHRRNLGCFP